MKKLVLIICACMATYSLKAQSFITINSDPSTAATGNVSVSATASGFSIYNNTASAALSYSKWEAAYSYSPYLWDFAAGNSLHTVAGFYKLSSKHSLALGMRYFNKANVMLTIDDEESVKQAKPWDMSAEIGYTFKINDMMGIAANLRYIRSDLGATDMNGTAVGVDVGYYLRVKKLSAGAMLSNVGSKIDFGTDKYDMPSWLKVGTSYEWTVATKHSITGSAQLDYNFQPKSEEGFSSGIGAEYSYRKTLFVRGGYRFADDLVGYSYTTVGLGAKLGFTSLNFAYIIADSNDPINKTMLISVGVRL